MICAQGQSLQSDAWLSAGWSALNQPEVETREEVEVKVLATQAQK